MKKLKFIMLSVFLLIVILLLGETTYPRLEQQALSQLYTVDTEFVDKSRLAPLHLTYQNPMEMNRCWI